MKQFLSVLIIITLLLPSVLFAQSTLTPEQRRMIAEQTQREINFANTFSIHGDTSVTNYADSLTGNAAQGQAAGALGGNTAGGATGGAAGAATGAAACGIGGAVATVVKSWVTGFVSSTLSLTTVPVQEPQQRAKETGVIAFPSWDSIGYCLINSIIEYIGTATVNWINSGFQGNPVFVDNPEQFFMEIADIEAGAFLNELTGGFLCSPLQAPVRINLATSYNSRISPYGNRARCTFTAQSGNLEQFLSGETFSWQDWISYFDLKNNQLGATMLAQIELDKRIANTIGVESKLLDWGRGFFSPRNEDNKITSPGSLIENRINDRLGSSERRIEMADEFDEIVTALVNQLVKIALSEIGDALSDNDSTPYNPSYFNYNNYINESLDTSTPSGGASSGGSGSITTSPVTQGSGNFQDNLDNSNSSRLSLKYGMTISPQEEEILETVRSLYSFVSISRPTLGNVVYRLDESTNGLYPNIEERLFRNANSMDIYGFTKVTFYTEPNFEGESQTFTEDLTTLRGTIFENNNVRSAKVESTLPKGDEWWLIKKADFKSKTSFQAYSDDRDWKIITNIAQSLNKEPEFDVYAILGGHQVLNSREQTISTTYVASDFDEIREIRSESSYNWLDRIGFNIEYFGEYLVVSTPDIKRTYDEVEITIENIEFVNPKTKIVGIERVVDEVSRSAEQFQGIYTDNSIKIKISKAGVADIGYDVYKIYTETDEGTQHTSVEGNPYLKWSTDQGSMNWNEAVNRCRNLTEDGAEEGDWKLPTIEQLIAEISSDWIVRDASSRFDFNKHYWSGTQSSDSFAHKAYWRDSIYSYTSSKMDDYSVYCVR